MFLYYLSLVQSMTLRFKSYLAVFTCLILFEQQAFSQTETPLLGLEHFSSYQGNYDSKNYPHFEKMKSQYSILRCHVSYGHRLKKHTDMVYNFSYQNINKSTNTSALQHDSTFLSIPKGYYQLPSFSTIGASFGTNTTLDTIRNWNWLNMLQFNYVNDFSTRQLIPSLYTGFFSYVEKKSKKLKYGIGIYISQLEGRIFYSPVISLSMKNDRRGLEMLFPEKIRLWQMIGKKGYFQLGTGLNANSLAFKPTIAEPTSIGNNIFLIHSTIGYHHIVAENFDLSLAIGSPIWHYSVYDNGERYEYTNIDGLSLQLGIRLILNEEK